MLKVQFLLGRPLPRCIIRSAPVSDTGGPGAKPGEAATFIFDLRFTIADRNQTITENKHLKADPLLQKGQNGRSGSLFPTELSKKMNVNDPVILFRPVGPKELALIRATGNRAFPPRL